MLEVMAVRDTFQRVGGARNNEHAVQVLHILLSCLDNRHRRRLDELYEVEAVDALAPRTRPDERVDVRSGIAENATGYGSNELAPTEEEIVRDGIVIFGRAWRGGIAAALGGAGCHGGAIHKGVAHGS